MCGTETGKRVKDKTVTGPTMGLTCNKGEPKVRPSLHFTDALPIWQPE